MRRRVPLHLAARLHWLLLQPPTLPSRVGAPVAFYALVLGVCVWLTLGPPLGLWQWVYWLPGLSFIRVPSRFMVLGVLALGVLVGLAFDRFTASRPARRRWLGPVAGLLLMAEFFVPPQEIVPYTIDVPPVERWVAQHLPPTASIVEVPVPDSLSVITQELANTRFMLYSTAHFRPIVQGYSGIQPPGYMDMHWQLTKFPDETSLRTMARLGVQYAVLHTDLIPPSERAEVEARFERWRDWVRLVHTEGTGRVYSLHWPADR